MSVSRLAKVKTGRIDRPLRFVFYGVEGVGKSSVCAAAPSPIFLDLEDGSGHLDVPRYTWRDDDQGHMPASYEEVKQAVRDLMDAKHDFSTLIIDTADRLEPLIWQYMLDRDCKRTGKKLHSIEDYGYGKGYALAVDEWRAFCASLDMLRLKRGMNIILVAHSYVRLYKNPEGEDFDRYQLRVHDKAAGFLGEWCDVLGFCCFEEGVAKLEEGSRVKGYSTGRRLCKLERTAAYNAKSRIPLPREVELEIGNPWKPLADAIERSNNQLNPKILIDLIGVELKRIGDDALTDSVKKAIMQAEGKVQLLNVYLNNLQTREVTQHA